MQVHSKTGQKSRSLMFFFAITLIALLAITVQANAQKYITFNVPGAGPGAQQGTWSIGVNARGSIVGQYIDLNGVYHGFLRRPNGKFAKFDPPGSMGTWAYALNDADVIAGWYADAGQVYHGYVRAVDGTITTFDCPGAEQAPTKAPYLATSTTSEQSQGSTSTGTA